MNNIRIIPEQTQAAGEATESSKSPQPTADLSFDAFLNFKKFDKNNFEKKESLALQSGF